MMSRRTAEHFHNCSSAQPLLLSYYLRPPGASQAEVPFADMLEEPIHFGLADIAANILPSGHGAVLP